MHHDYFELNGYLIRCQKLVLPRLMMQLLEPSRFFFAALHDLKQQIRGPRIAKSW